VLFSCLKSQFESEKSFAQSLAGERYKHYVFSGVDTSLFNIQYRIAKTYHNTDTILKLDVYQPAGDTISLRPTIVFIHGGAFYGGNEEDLAPLCDSFSKKGYVAISIGYRLGNDWPALNLADSMQKQLATIYRANQDARAAIRYIRKNSVVGRIDTTKIFLAGASAGSVTAINVAYLDQSEVAADFSSINGQLDGTGQYDYPGYSTKVKGIINLEGEIFDTAWIKVGDVPILSVYGTADQLYSFSGFDYISPHTPFYRGQSIHLRATNLSIPSIIKTYPGGAHGSVLSAANISATIAFITDGLFSQL